MGYTSGAAMEDRGLRDIERWRDKIEVHLDNRQVFFLFFGSALVACMLFVLGVIVGKRLESRGRAVSPEIEDPLALLDKVATSPRATQTNVTFPQALFGSASKSGAGDKHAKKGPSPSLVGPGPDNEVKPVAVASLGVNPATTGAQKSAVAVVQDKQDKQGTVKPVEKAAEPVAEKKPEAKPAGKPVAAAEAKPAGKSATAVEVKPAGKPAPAVEAKPAGKPAPAAEAKPIAIPVVAASPDGKGKGHFALQLSSFQDKQEAEAFAQKFQAEKPYLVVSEIPGKGTWYRVRVGDFALAKDALAAKQSFEKKHSVIAYIAQR